MDVEPIRFMVWIVHARGFLRVLRFSPTHQTHEDSLMRDSKLSTNVSVNGRLSLCVSSVMDRWPDVPCTSNVDQQTQIF